jgi:23S rRNA (guanosine2251-2'-O)-methyltransferase
LRGAPRCQPKKAIAPARRRVRTDGLAARQPEEPLLTRKKNRRPPERAAPAPERSRREAPAGRPVKAPPRRPAPGERVASRREARGDVAQIYGFHSVAAALAAPRRALIRLYATEAAAGRLSAAIAARGVETLILSNEEIAARAPREAVHQGVLLEARPLAPIDISELPERGLVVVLDQVTDPHNVGAILRSAAAFAVDALLTTERHSPDFTGALAKSASGGLEHVPICSVTNLARAMGELGEMGYLRVGLDSEGPQTLQEAVLSRPLALVFGAEGRGLRRLTRENCEILARLDVPGAIKSLNVSNACAVALAIAAMKLGAGG